MALSDSGIAADLDLTDTEGDNSSELNVKTTADSRKRSNLDDNSPVKIPKVC